MSPAANEDDLVSSAGVVRPGTGRWLFVAGVSGLVYHGGPVVAGDMKVYAIFWEPPGSFVSTGYHRLLKRFFKDVGSGLYEINEQYPDTSGHALTGAVLADAL